jgi:hypothetical protein
MRKHFIVAGVAAAALVPSFAFAQQSQIGCRSPITAGASSGSTGAQVATAVLGALLGRQDDCARAYGYYDAQGMWHANAVDPSRASGYFDREGRWVDGPPNGYYDPQGRWVTANTSAQASGYYDRNGRWVPASAGGYYDTDGRMVAGVQGGHWENGRWVAGAATGSYDVNGRWIPGQPSGRHVNGVWMADPQPGYYDAQGRWVRGPAQGYYDAQGRWVFTSQPTGYGQGYGQGQGYAQNQGYRPGYGQGQGYGQGYGAASAWAGAPTDLNGRIAWLDARINQGRNDGTLRRREANRALQSLSAIRVEAQGLRKNRRGRISARAEAPLLTRLDTLATGLRWSDNQRTSRAY